jgi:tetratricopeptide (TPR) repeat protein
MKTTWKARWTVLFFMQSGLLAQAGAEEYWGYSYQSIDVTAAGNSAYAVKLAHNLAQLDAALARTVGTDFGSSRAPLHVYALPSDTFKKVWGDGSSVFTSTGFENDILIDNSGAYETRYWDAYFGYTAALLATEGALHYPSWYRVGISSVFAASSIADDRVRVGGFVRNQALVLREGTLIPMRTLLRLHDGDPQLKDPDLARMYGAETWFFVHQILFDEKYQQAGAKYLELMSHGQAEEAAFAAGFNVSYEQLDEAMRQMIRQGKIRELSFTLPSITANGAPRLLSPAEVNARLAEFGVRHRHNLDGAVQRAREAINAEPDNERAWRVLARGQLLQEQYAQALQSVERLSSQASLSAAGYADCAHVLASIGEAVSQHHADVNADSSVLLQRAREDYSKAIELNGDDTSSFYALARMIVRQKDKDAANSLRPRMEQAQYRHPRDANLAHGLAELCVATGDLDGAFKFTVAWQKYAMSESDQRVATAYLSRIEAATERHATEDASLPDAREK